MHPSREPKGCNNRDKYRLYCSLIVKCVSQTVPFMATEYHPALLRPEDRQAIRASISDNPLNTNPITNIPRGNIPNTPLASSTIAFLLGSLFTFGIYSSVIDLSASAPWLTYQLGLFLSSLAFFHWAEFAVTAGWNLEKCSIDCMCF